MEVESEGEGREAVDFLLCELTGFLHLLEHDVAALACALVLAQRVVVGGVFYHAHECGCFFDGEILGCFAEVDVCGRFDADGVVEEVELVEIHFDDFLFGVVAFELDGYHPFDWFLHGSGEEAGA